MSAIVKLILFIWWLAGLVLAKGFWLTTISIFTPYGMYLVLEKIFVMIGGVIP